MRIALAQLNPTVGDIDGNTAMIRDHVTAARDGGADLVVFAELALLGYPPKDLLLKPRVIDRCASALRDVAEHCRGIAALVGLPQRTDKPVGRGLQNVVAICRDGAVAGSVTKSLLPTYDVFDEHRYFDPGAGGQLPEVAGFTVGVTICEDLWVDGDIVGHRRYDADPVADLQGRGVALVINCAASPFTVGKHDVRMRLLQAAAKRCGAPIVFCNQVGGNDELVFDGHSCVLDAAGRVIAHAKGFEEDLLFADIDGVSSSRIEPVAQRIESVYRALVLGLKDYARKCGFKQVVLGLSGGIDSAVTAAVAVAALGPDNVRGVAMPSRYSSEGSVRDAQALADNLGVHLDVIPIHDAHAALETMLAERFKGLDPDTTEENIQARIRGTVLMSLSNKFGSLLITTGNKSELAVGYCTLYGDMCGGLAVLSDVPKTMVWDLARWINTDDQSELRRGRGGPVIPQDTIDKPPSAELRPDQLDQDSLPPYDLLDKIIERYVERDQPLDQITAELPEADPKMIARIVRLIDVNEYKREQAAPGLKVTGRAFGFGRRMPIAQGYRP